MPKMTLKQVGRKAMTDRKFWTELRDHTARALAGIEMPEKDKALLRDVLKGRIKVDFKALVDGVHRRGSPYRQEVWRKSWPDMWRE